MFISRALEINHFQDENVKDVTRFVIKNNISAVVVKPEAAVAFVFERMTAINKFKIILAIDFPNGNNFGMSKFNNLPDSIFSADGFDIKMSPNLDVSKSSNELAMIHKFMVTKSKMLDIRWTLNLDTGSEVSNNHKLIEADKYPVSFIRHSSSLDVKLTLEQLKSQIVKMRNFTVKPLKMSGVYDYNTMIELMKIQKGPVKFDVTLGQAIKVLNDEKKAVEKNIKMAAEGKMVG